MTDLNHVCKYIVDNQKEDVIKILNDDMRSHHYALLTNFVKLFEILPDFGSEILTNPVISLNTFDKALVKAQRFVIDCEQNEEFTVKENVHVRIFGLPACPELHRVIFPKNCDLNRFFRITGTVVRTTAIKMLEHRRCLQCTKCKTDFVIEAKFEKKYVLEVPRVCPSDGCKGINFKKVNDKLQQDDCKDYQEVKLQEQINNLSIGTIPSSLWVVLEDDLVDTCKPGDNVSITGTVLKRSNKVSVGNRPDIELVLRANYIQVNNEQRSLANVTESAQNEIELFWKQHNPLEARNLILKSFCPSIFGLTLVKLSVALVLAGGSRFEGCHTRTEPHLLMVGDPGTGKSQLLRWAARVVPRSVLTTGIGSTAAGLTVTAIMEDGHWQLEAGALVLADGGVCCIDEFNSMREHDRTSIHEAMEQQTISVAKAGMVCKLSTKCCIIAAANFKTGYDSSQSLEASVAIASPLLSRFDLVLLIRDTIDEEWDTVVSEHILCGGETKEVDVHWPLETLQAYFIIIKSLNPALSEDANTILRTYYQFERQKPERNVSRTTVRMLDSLVRLSQAHARLMYRDEVIVMDALMAVHLCEVNTDWDVLRRHCLDPIVEYMQIVQTILKKLELYDILKRETEQINNMLGKRF